MKNLTAAALTLMMIAPVGAESKTAEALEKIRSEHSLPALGGIAIVDGEIKEPTAVGMRKFEGKQPVTADDKWHIGSCTKSMTATLAATFVEDGTLKWDSTLKEVFGRKLRMRDEYENVTLRNLLSNRSGIPGSASRAVLVKAQLSNGNRDIAKRRERFAEALLKMKPDFEPGTQYAYSNSGFVVAGAMLEAVSGKSWEELMQERLFKPLGMKSSGFGAAASKGKEDQPWGHRSKKKPQPPGPGDDNPDVIGPAGTVHCSLADLAAYVRMHALHEVGPVLKKAETFELLQKIAEGNDDYACGWVVTERPWADGSVLMHNGSNTMNYCVIWIAPKRKFGVIAVSNVDPESGMKPCDTAVSHYITTLLGRAAVDTKVSPFSGVRWEGDEPEVKVGAKWFKLVSIDGITAKDIMAFSQKTYGRIAKKRFAEDLVEVLAGMKHELKGSVTLVVQALGSSKTKTLEDVKMTKENRDSIREALKAAEE